jgi:hypothetical protein
LQSHRQLVRTVGLSVTKLVLLGAVAATARGAHAEFAIFSTWAIATVVSILGVTALSLMAGEKIWVAPGLVDAKPQVAKALKHHVLNISTLAPAIILPFIVAATISAEVNSAFFAGWMMLGVVLMIPSALTTVLFTVGVKDPAALAHNIGISLAISALAGIGATIGFYVLGDFVLGLFNPAYPAIMGPSLKFLGLSVFLVAIKYHYIAVQRLHNRMLTASVMLSVGAVAELTFAVIGARLGGLMGLTMGWMCAVLLQAIFMLPDVIAVSPWSWHEASRAR